jgi:type II secretory pathway component GspD/PulD (secretin)
MPGVPQQPQSEAKQAASRVVCVADEQSNSVIVAAPDEVIPTIKEIIQQVDTSITEVTETQIFRLHNADAVEMAATLTSLYGDTTNTNGNGNGNNNNNNNRGGRSGRGGGFPFPFPFGGQQSSGGGQSARQLQQAKVVSVGDPRTNSLIVTASHDSMIEIAGMVARLDETESKKQRVFVHSLQHADAENVANILRNMFGDTSSLNTRGSRLNQRIDTGASSDASDALNSTRGGGGGGLR